MPVRSLRRLATSAVLVALLFGMLSGLAPAPAGASGGWPIALGRHNEGNLNNELSGVSCASTSFCRAVGFYDNANHSPQTLIESWSGTSWSVVPRASNAGFLDAVSCASSSFCAAVGSTMEAWNGTTWSIVPSPNNQAGLDAVSCVSANFCVGVGSYSSQGPPLTLVESWNGSSWSIVPSPNEGSFDNYLSGVSCVSASSCTAVGYYQYQNGDTYTLIESWNGSSWSIVPGSNPGSSYNDLGSVSCPSAGSCTAVGVYLNYEGVDQTLVEHWNSTSWSTVPSPNSGTSGNVLASVACVSTSCTAAGYYNAARYSKTGATYPRKTLIESWNGTSWSIVSSPNRSATDTQFSGVSCASVNSCTPVGFYNNERIGATRTLIESTS